MNKLLLFANSSALMSINSYFSNLISFRKSFLFSVLLFFCFCFSLSGQTNKYLSGQTNKYLSGITIIYVNHAATGANDGTSWEDAYTSLQSALEIMLIGDHIWVAQGTYKPTQTKDNNTTGPDDRNNTFYIDKNIELHGGFAGTENVLTDRVLGLNPTMLSGDIGIADDNSDNTLHVLYIDGTTANGNINNDCIIDGFIIEKGNANGDYPDNFGGGIFNFGAGNDNQSNPTIRNCIFRANEGIFGGGLANHGRDNGMASSTLINCLFFNNIVNEVGGGIHNDGINFGNSSPIIINCTFSNNSAVNGGGGMFSEGHNSGNANPNLSNCIFWNNEENGVNNTFKAQIQNDNSNLIINHSIVNGIAESNNNLAQDPLFVDSANEDYHLMAGSPGINTGNNATIPINVTEDFEGNPRIFDSTIDMGASEYNLCPANGIFYVNKNNNAAFMDGTSWTTAYNDLQLALEASRNCPNTLIPQIWVATDNYFPSQTKDNNTTGPDDRNNTFYIDKNIALYGGFAGTENALEDRVLALNPTILSGDIGIVDDISDNTLHVLFINGTMTLKTIVS